MNKGKKLDFISLFRLPSYLLVTSVAGIVLGSLGLGMAAVGLLIGVTLYVANLFFLYEGGKSLLGAESRRNGRMTATMASIGRMFFLSVALAFVLRIGVVPFFAACGGVLVGQVNLHLMLLVEGRIERRCSGL
ncbi:MAG TPA: hypothetical protein ENH11_07685 [Candidatus Acetothermia bacterium]|nr:hypothetical protein [Candidatus Acetothermia bacterium]